MTEYDASDTDLVDLLRTALGSMPERSIPADLEPPTAVLDGARWVHDWLTMDAELAELTFDSSEHLELAGTRAESRLRELTFVAGARTIEIEIEPLPRGVRVAGVITPAVEGNVELIVGGVTHTAIFDGDGEFALEPVAHGTALAFVRTDAGRIRLGAFEI